MLQAVRRTTSACAQLLQDQLQVRFSGSTSGPSSANAAVHIPRFNPEMLPYLVCPLTEGSLRYDGNKQELISEEINVAYPIIDGIPRLVPTAGRVMDATDTLLHD